MNLAFVPGTYAYELNNNIVEIRRRAQDHSVSLMDYKKFVHNIASKAEATSTRRNFINNMYSKTSKYSIMIYCHRVISKAGRPAEWNSYY